MLTDNDGEAQAKHNNNLTSTSLEFSQSIFSTTLEFSQSFFYPLQNAKGEIFALSNDTETIWNPI